MRNNIVHGRSVGYSAELRKGRKRYRAFVGIIFPFVLERNNSFILNIPERLKSYCSKQKRKTKKYANAQYDSTYSACNRSDCGCDTYCCVPQWRNGENLQIGEAFFLKYRNGQRICSVIIRKSIMIGLQVCSSIPTNLWIQQSISYKTVRKCLNGNGTFTAKLLYLEYGILSGNVVYICLRKNTSKDKSICFYQAALPEK